ncbi:hypothetical protein KR009_009304 [Drosophila setifemur]|nr:hypothetical protein KR009_009304 [Drosophila setifemur]
MLHLLVSQRILLMVLLFGAPLRSAPFGGAHVAMARQRDWDWDPDWLSNGNPVPAATAREFDDLYPVDGGNPLPKSSGPEMDNQLSSGYFPSYPELLDKQMHLQHNKQLQMRHKWQSPPAVNKRAPIRWPPPDDSNEEQLTMAGEPRYPSAYGHVHNLPWKRKSMPPPQKLRYLPSISAGAMTNLGDFFNQLEANVRFAEQSQLGESEMRLLGGHHPAQVLPPPLPPDVPNDAVQQQEHNRKKEKLWQAFSNYRPSQKIRSLVSRNPQGYRGSQFIDPSYMWLGLGK